ncbi:MAG: FAD-dependent oxidoreductase, partial [Nitrospirae bacterium]|nr:FAD-dependent oxidoreductase [Nitrospirota bacterium]
MSLEKNISALPDRADFLICGAGIIGLTIARELAKKGAQNIFVLEKETELGRHASGRNSGVLHAGIYYSPDSLRARSCLKGNFLMKHYCREKNLPVLETGKVIVAKNDEETETLKELYKRALKNGARVELIDEKRLKEIEPHAKTHRTALYSLDTSVVDPKLILKSQHSDLTSTGAVKFLAGTELRGIKGSNTAVTSYGPIKFETFINASGAYSDKVAHFFGVGLNYKLIPFKGIYRKLRSERSSIVKGNIYPVPDIRNPFLGIHFTRNVNGEIYLGPTAIPALGRENYGILQGADLESINILFRDALLFAFNARLRNTAFAEIKKYFFTSFFEDAERLMTGLNKEDILPYGKT